MWQVMSGILVILIIIFVFVPLAVLNSNTIEIMDIKESLNLSARVLDNSLAPTSTASSSLELGYDRTNSIEVDKDRLLIEFYDILLKNCQGKNRFENIKSRLYIKLLVYEDSMYVADQQDKWSPPFFFICYDNILGDIYLNTQDDKAYYYEGPNKINTDIGTIGLSKEKKNDIIIEKINQVIESYTYSLGERNSLNMRIKNPYRQDVEQALKDSYFNVLEGTTFLVVYAEDTKVNVYSKDFSYHNYNVTGYTMQ